MDLKEVQKELSKKSPLARFSLTEQELKDILAEAVDKGMLEERKWHTDGGRFDNDKNLPADPFYSGPIYQHGSEQVLVPYNFTDKEIKNDPHLKVIEDNVGFRISNTGEGLLRGNKYLTQSQLFLIQDAAYIKAHTDPLGKSIIKNFVNFTIGRGADIDCIIPDIELVMKTFRSQNRMDRREKEMVKHTFINGEFFNCIRVGKKGNCRIYGIPPQDIVDFDYSEDDYENILSFKKIDGGGWAIGDTGSFQFPTGKEVDEWIPSVHYDELTNGDFAITAKHKGINVKDKYMHYIKYGNYDEVRGRSSYQPILKSLRFAEDYTIDRMRLNHERSKVVMIKTVTGGTSTQDNPQVAPRGGIILVATNNIKYEFLDSHINAQDSKDDGMWILYNIGAGIVMPVHILQQRADQAVYASLKKMDSPFSQNVISWQDFFEESWKDLDKFVIQQKVKAGELAKEYRVPAYVGLASGRSFEGVEFFSEINSRLLEMVIDGQPEKKIVKEILKQIKKAKMNKTLKMAAEDVPITRTFPDTIREEPLDVAKVLFLHRKMNLVSIATASKRAGYDFRTELEKIMAEKTAGLDVGMDKDDGTEKKPREPDSGTDKRQGDSNIRMSDDSLLLKI